MEIDKQIEKKSCRRKSKSKKVLRKKEKMGGAKNETKWIIGFWRKVLDEEWKKKIATRFEKKKRRTILKLKV